MLWLDFNSMCWITLTHLLSSGAQLSGPQGMISTNSQHQLRTN